MAPRTAERIMNLAICLLMARRFVPKEEIREVIEQYRERDDEAFERMFERDKDDLRRLGVPVQTGSNDPLFPDEVGYRILRKEFELPPIEFTAAELTVLGLSSQVWDQATQADQAKSALAKLRAAGVDPDPQRLAAMTAQIGVKEEAFGPMWQAVSERIPVRFTYHGKERSFQPWAMTNRRGAWYVYGFDLAAQAPRIYRLIRFESAVQFAGNPATFAPEPVDAEVLKKQIEAAAPDTKAVLAIRAGRVPSLTRRGSVVAEAEVPPGFQAYQVSYSADADFAAELASKGPDVLVVEPQTLRDAVIDHLKRMVAR